MYQGARALHLRRVLRVAGPLIMVTRLQRECRKSPNLSHSPQGVAGVFFAPGEGLLLVFEIQRKETDPSPGANYAPATPCGRVTIKKEGV